MDAKPTLDFLKKLKKNNSKEWFDKNRKTYEDVKADLVETVTALIHEISLFDPSVKTLEAKKCIFRINRDVRFSKDKKPYKANLGASISAGGKKSAMGGYYFHIEPGNSFLAGGIYMPDGDLIKKLRQEIDYSPKDFDKIINAKDFKKYFGGFSDEEKLSRAPKGYPEDHPHVQYLKQKHFIVVHSIKDSDLDNKAFIKNAGKVYKAMLPLNQFLNRIFEG